MVKNVVVEKLEEGYVVAVEGERDFYQTAYCSTKEAAVNTAAKIAGNLYNEIPVYGQKKEVDRSSIEHTIPFLKLEEESLEAFL